MARQIGKVVDLTSLDAVTQKLIKDSVEVAKLAYAPYSNFSVGAALLCKNGETFTGCNVENASYGLSICAERTAIVKAVSSGNQEFTKIAVAANNGDQIAAPCGACRQFISEFRRGADIPIYLTNFQMSRSLETSIVELLPLDFSFQK